MIKAISVLEETHNEFGKVIEELKELEDGVDVDWSEVVMDYKWILQQCKHRVTTLKMRK
jgi:hypothetical protein